MFLPAFSGQNFITSESGSEEIASAALSLQLGEYEDELFFYDTHQPDIRDSVAYIGMLEPCEKEDVKIEEYLPENIEAYEVVYCGRNREEAIYAMCLLQEQEGALPHFVYIPKQ
jgi:hypothetical protein